MTKNAFDAEQGNTAEELLGRIGQLTRQLREGLRELGLDKEVAKAAQAIPDARDRLAYVAATTERAAHRALNAIDVAQPLQEGLATDAKGLTKRWDEWFANPVELDQARALVMDTRGYLQDVPNKTNAINTQLMEILMAQDFQDLTGQVIKKMMEVVNDMETELLQVLIDNTPLEKRQEIVQNSLQNGPQIVAGNPDAVADQSQVDDLLESLGF
ncbi:protein phosphatase CheZ [Variovorax saccharolyticus]|uniref:protein phosphatase CheZ n=1 Tax=Variovorax saccharolyticus TaxID=3053516 RepID=UPI002575AB7A|nr:MULTISPECIES: protein phosphatase CheZ [unclassified Variovorax]MDM0021281.1 protein phosphatase CheZ [Variovorax sp. J22R187]MDM0027290.1 protein phosphatase CheZ [Variovorax sp. J31P216]